MTSADPYEPYLRFVERVIDALEELLQREREAEFASGSFEQEFTWSLDETIERILNHHHKGNGS